jgi:hypothetical protein
MQNLTTWLNAIGLVLNIVGVVMAFFYGFPQPNFDGVGVRRLQPNTPMPDGRALRRHYVEVFGTKITYQNISSCALFFMLVGFASQLAAVLIAGEVWKMWG